MQDFAPNDLGPVTRPVRMDYCPRCNAEVRPDAASCWACSVVLAKARAAQATVRRPPPPVIVAEEPARVWPGVLVACLALTGAGVWWMRHPAPAPAPAQVIVEPARPAAAPAVGPGFVAPAPWLGDAPQVQPTAVPVAAAQDSGGVRDSNGHGEDWWRARETSRQARLAAAQKAAADARYIADSAANGSAVTRLSEEAGRAQVAALQARADLLDGQVAAIEAEAEALHEECRKANCYPGWLR